MGLTPSSNLTKVSEVEAVSSFFMTSVSFNSRTTSLAFSDTYGDSSTNARLFRGLTTLLLASEPAELAEISFSFLPIFSVLRTTSLLLSIETSSFSLLTLLNSETILLVVVSVVLFNLFSVVFSTISIRFVGADSLIASNSNTLDVSSALTCPGSAIEPIRVAPITADANPTPLNFLSE